MDLSCSQRAVISLWKRKGDQDRVVLLKYCHCCLASFGDCLGLERSSQSQESIMSKNIKQCADENTSLLWACSCVHDCLSSAIVSLTMGALQLAGCLGLSSRSAAGPQTCHFMMFNSKTILGIKIFTSLPTPMNTSTIYIVSIIIWKPNIACGYYLTTQLLMKTVWHTINYAKTY